MNLLFAYSSANSDNLVHKLTKSVSEFKFDIKSIDFSLKATLTTGFLTSLEGTDAVIFLPDSTNEIDLGFLIAFCIKEVKLGIFICDAKLAKKLEYLNQFNDELYFLSRDSEDIPDQIIKILKNKSSEKPTRFNFFLSPQLSYYLDWVSKNKKISRSVYLRQLLDKASK